MDSVILTDNKSDMIRMGKEIFASRNFSTTVIEEIKFTINTNMPDSPEEEKLDIFYQCIYDYWAFGISVQEEFSFGLKDKSVEERLEYIPYRWRLRYIWQINNKKHAHLLHNKYETYQLLKPYYLRDVIELTSFEDYTRFIKFIDAHPEFVVKTNGLSGSVGVYKVDSSAYVDKKNLFNKILLGGRESTDKYKCPEVKSVVIEAMIEQSPKLSAIHPFSVNGIRVTTMRVEDRIEIIYPWFMVGANHSFVTSAVTGTYYAGIDVETGIVNTNGFKDNGNSDTVHSDTGIAFKGYEIPCWRDCIDLAKELALKFTSINYIGWDLVLTPKGWCVMEGNFSGTFKWQMFLQKGYASELKRLTNWERDADFWWQ